MELGTTVYIAGKMRGVRYMNFIEFFRWHHVLETSGYVVLNPAASDVERFFRPWYRKALGCLWRVFIWRSWYEDVMRYDLNLIREKADWLFVLKDWETSEGANREIALARELGLPVFFEDRPITNNPYTRECEDGIWE